MGLIPPVSNSPTIGTNFDDLMKEAKELIEKKDKIEQELRELEDRLLEAGIGMEEPLVDNSGFPRSEIDVHSVRISRNLVIRLRNDHKAVMKDIESVLYKIHEAKRNSTDESNTTTATSGESIPTTTTTNTTTTTTTATATEQPEDTFMTEVPVAFAIVNAVAPDSPAYSAGLRRNDSIIKFGSIDVNNHQRLQALNVLISQSENQSLDITVLRDGVIQSMSVTPRTGWGGRGTLGCHLLPL